MTIDELYCKIRTRKAIGHFQHGVTEYAKEMLESVIGGDYDGIDGKSFISALKVSHLLNHVGGDSIAVRGRWNEAEVAKIGHLCSEASRGGNFLVYDSDILERLCPPSQRRRNASRAMELQARALWQAVNIIGAVAHNG